MDKDFEITLKENTDLLNGQIQTLERKSREEKDKFFEIE